jgi:hypothetical protein
VPLPSFTTTSLEGEALAAALTKVPVSAGVGQILGPDARNLVIGRAANLRRWAATHLGAGRKPRAGERPPIDLRPVATAVAYAVTTTSFLQRLTFERLMARYVSPAARRDLKAAAYLHLDPNQRFPRLEVWPGAQGGAGVFGPFRGAKEAGRAREALHKIFPLRPCDYVFEPDPSLALGQGCLFAQIRTCSAPCLMRITGDAYRALARETARFLAQPEARRDASQDCLPPRVAAADGRGLVVEQGPNGIEIYPVRAGAVLEEESRMATASEDVETALESMLWAPPDPPRDDWPWLLAWLGARRCSGHYLAVGASSEPAEVAARLRAVLALPRG